MTQKIMFPSKTLYWLLRKQLQRLSRDASDLMVCDRARIPSTKKYMDSKRLMYSWENI